MAISESKLEYTVSLPRDEIEGEIALHVAFNHRASALTVEQAHDLAKEAVDLMLKEGNDAVFNGLVDYAIKVLKKNYEEGKVKSPVPLYQ